MMRNRKIIIAALVAAAAASATVCVLPYIVLAPISVFESYSHPAVREFAREFQQIAFIWNAAFVVALAHAVIFGLPAYFLLRRKNLIRWWTAIICGLVIGIVPGAIFTFPVAHPGSGYEADGITLMANGIVTFEGWMSYIRGTAMFGFYGALGGFVAWYVWQSAVTTEETIKRK